MNTVKKRRTETGDIEPEGGTPAAQFFISVSSKERKLSNKRLWGSKSHNSYKQTNSRLELHVRHRRKKEKTERSCGWGAFGGQ